MGGEIVNKNIKPQETWDLKLTEGRGLFFVTSRSSMFQDEEVRNGLELTFFYQSFWLIRKTVNWCWFWIFVQSLEISKYMTQKKLDAFFDKVS